ncbi:MAG TPA: flagellar basal body L-ring protein FlgH [Terriglobales bacterium]|nr:flagellar basal body L-ring protein FlgH [Terriglobales bacterium]
MRRTVFRLVLFLLLASTLVWAKEKTIQRESLEEYLRRLSLSSPLPEKPAPGSLWTDQGRLADFSTDYKAAKVGDTITILVSQSLQANNTGNVASDRSFKASSGINALAGHISTSGVQNIFSPQSSATLAGKAQASSNSSLKTSLAGQVAAVLPNGMLVIEAERQITMNNERQTILLRGLVRPGDISPDNAVASNVVGNLQLEIKGKGVISDGTRPPNLLVRMLLRLVGF